MKEFELLDVLVNVAVQEKRYGPSSESRKRSIQQEEDREEDKEIIETERENMAEIDRLHRVVTKLEMGKKRQHSRNRIINETKRENELESQAALQSEKTQRKRE